MQKHVNLVDLVKSFPTNIFLQKLASIQERTSPIEFDNFAEKSEQGSISNLSTKRNTARSSPPGRETAATCRRPPETRSRASRRRSSYGAAVRAPGTPRRAADEEV